MIFECHITCDTANAVDCELVAKEQHWKTSQIERDPVLGNRTFFYLTSHSTDYMEMFDRMKQAARTLGMLGVPVIREKIELIIYDTKTKGVQPL